MSRTTLTLHPSEAVVVQAAATIYAAYQASARVPGGQEQEWMSRAIKEARWIARATDDAVRSDDEMG